MLKFKGNVSAKQVVDSLIKGKANPLKKRKFCELDPPENSFANKEEAEENKNDDEKQGEFINKYKTPAELSFGLAKKKRIMERVNKKLESSHKEKIEKFNKNLSKLSDHFDIPRVGPG